MALAVTMRRIWSDHPELQRLERSLMLAHTSELVRRPVGMDGSGPLGGADLQLVVWLALRGQIKPLWSALSAT